MSELPDGEIRGGIDRLVDGAPPAPEWSQVDRAGQRRRRRSVVLWCGAAVVALLAGVAVVSAQVDDGALVVAGPDGGRSNAELPECGTAWIAVHTVFDSSVNQQSDPSVVRITAEQAAFLAKSGDVPDRVAQRLGGNAAELADRIVARSNENLGTIEVIAWADSPGEARELSDAFAEGLLASVTDIQNREIARNRDVLTSAIAQLELELVGIVGDDRAAVASRERLQSEIDELEVQLQELDQKVAQGSNIYSFGSSEAFQITADQLERLFEPSWAYSQSSNQATTRELRDVENESNDC